MRILVRGRSMEPALQDGDVIEVETGPRVLSLEPGDVVVYRNVDGYDVKRIAATGPCDVSYDRGWLTVDGTRTTFVGGRFPATGRIDRDEFFVLGDDLRRSLDSRSFGPVSVARILGKVAGDGSDAPTARLGPRRRSRPRGESSAFRREPPAP